MFDGDIRKQEVENIMGQVRKLTLAQMKHLYSQIAMHHDSIVIASDERWLKPNDPNWEDHL